MEQRQTQLVVALHRATDHLQYNGSRYEQVRTRVRRQRGYGYGATLLAGAAVLVVGSGISLPATQPGESFGTGCPGPTNRPGTHRLLDGADVPDGASWALLCVDDNQHGPVLTDHVDELVAKLNALVSLESGVACPPSTPDYDLVIGYPGGRRIVLPSEAGCGIVPRTFDELVERSEPN